jgi:CheY-like chemotaxis protein
VPLEHALCSSSWHGIRFRHRCPHRGTGVRLPTLLEMAGHRAQMAHNGLDALRPASRERYDAVVLDLGMPVMDGFEAGALLAQLQPAPLLLAYSAWDDAQARRRTAELGFAAHLTKPAPLSVLQATLERARPAAERSMPNPS